LIVREPQTSGSELFPQSAVLLLKVVDDVALLLIDPPGEPDENESQRIRWLSTTEIRLAGPGFVSLRFLDSTGAVSQRQRSRSHCDYVLEFIWARAARSYRSEKRRHLEHLHQSQLRISSLQGSQEKALPLTILERM